MGFVKYPASVKAIAIQMRTQGKSYCHIRKAIGYNISTRSFERWMALFQQTKAVIRRPTSQLGRPRFFNHELQILVKSLVERYPALFLSEIKQILLEETGLEPSTATLDVELRRRLCLTLKKANVGNVRKSLLEKAAFIHDIADVPAEYLVFTGE